MPILPNLSYTGQKLVEAVSARKGEKGPAPPGGGRRRKAVKLAGKQPPRGGPCGSPEPACTRSADSVVWRFPLIERKPPRPPHPRASPQAADPPWGSLEQCTRDESSAAVTAVITSITGADIAVFAPEPPTVELPGIFRNGVHRGTSTQRDSLHNGMHRGTVTQRDTLHNNSGMHRDTARQRDSLHKEMHRGAVTQRDTLHNNSGMHRDTATQRDTLHNNSGMHRDAARQRDSLHNEMHRGAVTQRDTLHSNSGMHRDTATQRDSLYSKGVHNEIASPRDTLHSKGMHSEPAKPCDSLHNKVGVPRNTAKPRDPLYNKATRSEPTKPRDPPPREPGGRASRGRALGRTAGGTAEGAAPPQRGAAAPDDPALRSCLASGARSAAQQQQQQQQQQPQQQFAASGAKSTFGESGATKAVSFAPRLPTLSCPPAAVREPPAVGTGSGPSGVGPAVSRPPTMREARTAAAVNDQFGNHRAPAVREAPVMRKSNGPCGANPAVLRPSVMQETQSTRTGNDQFGLDRAPEAPVMRKSNGPSGAHPAVLHPSVMQETQSTRTDNDQFGLVRAPDVREAPAIRPSGANDPAASRSSEIQETQSIRTDNGQLGNARARSCPPAVSRERNSPPGVGLALSCSPTEQEPPTSHGQARGGVAPGLVTGDGVPLGPDSVPTGTGPPAVSDRNSANGTLPGSANGIAAGTGNTARDPSAAEGERSCAPAPRTRLVGSNEDGGKSPVLSIGSQDGESDPGLESPTQPAESSAAEGKPTGPSIDSTATRERTADPARTQLVPNAAEEPSTGPGIDSQPPPVESTATRDEKSDPGLVESQTQLTESNAVEEPSTGPSIDSQPSPTATLDKKSDRGLESNAVEGEAADLIHESTTMQRGASGPGLEPQTQLEPISVEGTATYPSSESRPQLPESTTAQDTGFDPSPGSQTQKLELDAVEGKVADPDAESTTHQSRAPSHELQTQPPDPRTEPHSPRIDPPATEDAHGIESNKIASHAHPPMESMTAEVGESDSSQESRAQCSAPNAAEDEASGPGGIESQMQAVESTTTGIRALDSSQQSRAQCVASKAAEVEASGPHVVESQAESIESTISEARALDQQKEPQPQRTESNEAEHSASVQSAELQLQAEEAKEVERTPPAPSIEVDTRRTASTVSASSCKPLSRRAGGDATDPAPESKRERTGTELSPPPSSGVAPEEVRSVVLAKLLSPAASAAGALRAADPSASRLSPTYISNGQVPTVCPDPDSLSPRLSHAPPLTLAAHLSEHPLSGGAQHPAPALLARCPNQPLSPREASRLRVGCAAGGSPGSSPHGTQPRRLGPTPPGRSALSPRVCHTYDQSTGHPCHLLLGPGNPADSPGQPYQPTRDARPAHAVAPRRKAMSTRPVRPVRPQAPAGVASPKAGQAGARRGAADGEDPACVVVSPPPWLEGKQGNAAHRSFKSLNGLLDQGADDTHPGRHKIRHLFQGNVTLRSLEEHGMSNHEMEQCISDIVRGKRAVDPESSFVSESTREPAPAPPPPPKRRMQSRGSEHFVRASGTFRKLPPQHTVTLPGAPTTPRNGAGGSGPLSPPRRAERGFPSFTLGQPPPPPQGPDVPSFSLAPSRSPSFFGAAPAVRRWNPADENDSVGSANAAAAAAPEPADAAPHGAGWKVQQALGRLATQPSQRFLTEAGGAGAASWSEVTGALLGGGGGAKRKMSRVPSFSLKRSFSSYRDVKNPARTRLHSNSRLRGADGDSVNDDMIVLFRLRKVYLKLHPLVHVRPPATLPDELAAITFAAADPAANPPFPASPPLDVAPPPAKPAAQVPARKPARPAKSPAAYPGTPAQARSPQGTPAFDLEAAASGDKVFPPWSPCYAPYCNAVNRKQEDLTMSTRSRTEQESAFANACPEVSSQGDDEEDEEEEEAPDEFELNHERLQAGGRSLYLRADSIHAVQAASFESLRDRIKRALEP
ncbi:hypothetical protein DIPPA_24078 [Diplonema papillatum]|nr:hypothetical protein DIPPA_24078 [Diplonema papillatum]